CQHPAGVEERAAYEVGGVLVQTGAVELHVASEIGNAAAPLGVIEHQRAVVNLGLATGVEDGAADVAGAGVYQGAVRHHQRAVIVVDAAADAGGVVIYATSLDEQVAVVVVDAAAPKAVVHPAVVEGQRAFVEDAAAVAVQARIAEAVVGLGI